MNRETRRILPLSCLILISSGMLAWTLMQPEEAPENHRPPSITALRAESALPSRPSAREDSRSASAASANADGQQSGSKRFQPAAGQRRTSSSTLTSPALADMESPSGPEHTRRRHAPSSAHRSTGSADSMVANPPASDAVVHASSTNVPEASGSLPSVPQEAPKPPVVFSLPELPADPGSIEAEIIYQAQESFAEEMASAPEADISSPAYAEHWKRATEAHDDFLRRTLGWDRFNRLSALASQQRQAESGSGN